MRSPISTPPAKQKAPTWSGPFASQEERSLVARHHRAGPAKVEAIDQFAADGLHVFSRILGSDEAARHDGRQRRCYEAGAEKRILGAVARVTILGFPEQAREDIEAIFVAGADKPAPVGLPGEGEAGRRIVDEVGEGNALETGLGV